MSLKKVQIFTDGACRGNPGIGGWGALLRYDGHEKQLSGVENPTTNNRMELMGAIAALNALTESCSVELYTDSQYVQKGISMWIQTWRKRNWQTANRTPVKNADLWQKLDALAQKHHVVWHWVRGHNGHHENELVDRLANLAIDKFLLINR